MHLYVRFLFSFYLLILPVTLFFSFFLSSFISLLLYFHSFLLAICDSSLLKPIFFLSLFHFLLLIHLSTVCLSVSLSVLLAISRKDYNLTDPTHYYNRRLRYCQQRMQVLIAKESRLVRFVLQLLHTPSTHPFIYTTTYHLFPDACAHTEHSLTIPPSPINGKTKDTFIKLPGTELKMRQHTHTHAHTHTHTNKQTHVHTHTHTHTCTHTHMCIHTSI